MDVTINGLSSADAWKHENAFYWFSPPSRLDKALAQYELYKRVLDLPGSILEFGVYKGASLIRFAQFRRVLETDTSRRLVGFDAFGPFPRSGNEGVLDDQFIHAFEAEGGQGLGADELSSILAFKSLANIELVKGDVFHTLPSYLQSHPETCIALLHLDLDVYEPSKYVLETCFDRIVPGGLLVIDDYNAVEGATRAVNEFVQARGLTLNKLPMYNVPAYVVR